MTPAIHHYPRRFRWEDERDRDKVRDMATLFIDGRHAGGLIRYSDRRGWWTWGEDWSELHQAPFARRCDAKRAVECAAVTARTTTEETEIKQ